MSRPSKNISLNLRTLDDVSFLCYTKFYSSILSSTLVSLRDQDKYINKIKLILTSANAAENQFNLDDQEISKKISLEESVDGLTVEEYFEGMPSRMQHLMDQQLKNVEDEADRSVLKMSLSKIIFLLNRAKFKISLAVDMGQMHMVGRENVTYKELGGCLLSYATILKDEKDKDQNDSSVIKSLRTAVGNEIQYCINNHSNLKLQNKLQANITSLKAYIEQFAQCGVNLDIENKIRIFNFQVIALGMHKAYRTYDNVPVEHFIEILNARQAVNDEASGQFTQFMNLAFNDIKINKIFLAENENSEKLLNILSEAVTQAFTLFDSEDEMANTSFGLEFLNMVRNILLKKHPSGSPIVPVARDIMVREFDVNVSMIHAELLSQEGIKHITISRDDHKLREILIYLKSFIRNDPLMAFQYQALISFDYCSQIIRDHANKSQARDPKRDIRMYEGYVSNCIFFINHFKNNSFENIRGDKMRLMLGNMLIMQIKLVDVFEDQYKEAKSNTDKFKALEKAKNTLFVALDLVVLFSATKNMDLNFLQKRELNILESFIDRTQIMAKRFNKEIPTANGTMGLFEIFSEKVQMLTQLQNHNKMKKLGNVIKDKAVDAYAIKHGVRAEEQQSLREFAKENAQKNFKEIMAISKKEHEEELANLRKSQKERRGKFEKAWYSRYDSNDSVEIVEISDDEAKQEDLKIRAIRKFENGEIDEALTLFELNNIECEQFDLAKEIKQFCNDILSNKKDVKFNLKHLENVSELKLVNCAYLYVGRSIMASKNIEGVANAKDKYAINAYEGVCEFLQNSLNKEKSKENVDDAKIKDLSLMLAKNKVELAGCHYRIGCEDICAVNLKKLDKGSKSLTKSLKLINEAVEVVRNFIIDRDVDHLVEISNDGNLDKFVPAGQELDIVNCCVMSYGSIKSAIEDANINSKRELNLAEISRSAAKLAMGDGWYNKKKQGVSQETKRLQDLREIDGKLQKFTQGSRQLSIELKRNVNKIKEIGKEEVFGDISIDTIKCDYKKDNPSSSISNHSALKYNNFVREGAIR